MTSPEEAFEASLHAMDNSIRERAVQLENVTSLRDHLAMTIACARAELPAGELAGAPPAVWYVTDRLAELVELLRSFAERDLSMFRAAVTRFRGDHAAMVGGGLRLVDDDPVPSPPGAPPR